MDLRKYAMEKYSSEKQVAENIHKNHRSRLKEQYLQNGFDSLTEVQKLEILLFYCLPQKDTNPIAHELLAKFKTLQGVLSANYYELLEINGVKENTAVFLNLINDFSGLGHQKDSADIYISSTSDAVKYISRLFFNVPVEQFYVVCLTKTNKVCATTLIDSGTVDEVNIQIRNVTETAINNKCNRIIIAHNHPRGRGRVSDDDFSFTYSLTCSCLLNNIDVLDHIVVGTDKSVSFKNLGHMQLIVRRACEKVQIPLLEREQFEASEKTYIDDLPKEPVV